MARLWYGGTPADFAVALGASVAIPDSSPAANGRVALLPETAVAFQVYDDDGGSAVTDLLGADGLPITELTSSTDDANLGAFPRFQGPDGWVDDLYASSDGTTFYRLPPSTDTLYDRVAVVETAVDTLSLDDLGDVNVAAATAGQVLTLSGGQWVGASAGAGTVTTINGVAAVAGNVTLGPADLSPAAGTASGQAALAAIIGTRLLQTGGGYPARPAAAQWVHYIGTATPVTGVQDGDIWDQPVTT